MAVDVERGILQGINTSLLQLLIFRHPKMDNDKIDTGPWLCKSSRVNVLGIQVHLVKLWWWERLLIVFWLETTDGRGQHVAVERFTRLVSNRIDHNSCGNEGARQCGFSTKTNHPLEGRLLGNTRIRMLESDANPFWPPQSLFEKSEIRRRDGNTYTCNRWRQIFSFFIKRAIQSISPVSRGMLRKKRKELKRVIATMPVPPPVPHGISISFCPCYQQTTHSFFGVDSLLLAFSVELSTVLHTAKLPLNDATVSLQRGKTCSWRFSSLVCQSRLQIKNTWTNCN